MREGQDDHAHNRDHSKKRHFKKDEDQKAYEAGYQKGHGKRSCRRRTGQPETLSIDLG